MHKTIEVVRIVEHLSSSLELIRLCMDNFGLIELSVLAQPRHVGDAISTRDLH